MKIKDLAAALPDLSREQRAAILENLARHLCAISVGQLLQFQHGWDYSRPFEEFRAAQDEQFKTCLAMELSDFGIATRGGLGLEPLDPEMELA